MTRPNSETDSVIDAEELLSRMMGSVDLAQRMLLRFVESATDEADLLESLIRSGDVQETGSLAHRHAGTAKTLAMHSVAQVSMQIENHVKRQPMDCSRLLEMMHQLRQHHREVTEFAESKQIYKLAAGNQGDLQ